MKKIFLLPVFLALFACGGKQKEMINLAGQWQFSLDSTDVGMQENWQSKKLMSVITLPGTTDAAGYGTPSELEPALEKPQLLHLTRKHSYLGAAWYQREVNIPDSWQGKSIELKLERVIWNTRVWVDGKEVGTQESLVSPHYFDLSTSLTSGKHTITIRVDNRKQHDISVRNLAHAYTDDTQVIWNGILGEISLTMSEPLFVDNIQLYPNIAAANVRAAIAIKNGSKQMQFGTLKCYAVEKKSGKKLPVLEQSVAINDAVVNVEIVYPMGKDVKHWSELSPALYEFTAELIAVNGKVDLKSQVFGMREITNRNAQLQINGVQAFMRGTLECNVFPLTGTPPLDKKGWEKVFKTAKEWGLNHLRFPSWCPPHAAFEVADELGVYLQVELPLWWLQVGADEVTNKFLQAEAQRIIREYGNHPSFCFWSMGNELEGEFSFLTSLVDSLKKQDPRHLYMSTTFTFQKGHGVAPEACDDFFVTQWTSKGWVRGQGVFNNEPPTFNKNYAAAVDGISVPVITHEIGQYAVYPNLAEIAKYKGALVPLNFMAVEQDLKEKGLLPKAKDYLMASGKFAAILYKEEVERAMKTPGVSGFQLLDLHDFPGQGTALVGLLNAFWDSKGLIEAKDFRSFCSPIVPLISYPKSVYENSETFTAAVVVSNFSEQRMENAEMHWNITTESGTQVASGKFSQLSVPIGIFDVAQVISADLSAITEAQKLTITLSIAGKLNSNSWSIWVYPSQLADAMGNVFIVDDIGVAEKALSQGRKVLFNPDWRRIKGVEGKFVPVFWSPVHFPKQAGTMGLLCNPNHVAFQHFPTDMHSNWQWWDLCKQSQTLVLDSISPVTPIVENVDNFVSNRRLASIFEARVGKGMLVFSAMDISHDLEKRPAARQLRYSLLQYMNSTAFNPQHTISTGEFTSFIKDDARYSQAMPESIY